MQWVAGNIDPVLPYFRGRTLIAGVFQRQVTRKNLMRAEAGERLHRLNF
jgi:hypothetical protein